MTLTQTVEIPNDRWLKIKVPSHIPTGRTSVVIQFPVQEAEQPDKTVTKDNNGKIRLTEELKEKLLQGEALRSLTGILHTDMTLDEIRMERLAKHLK